jgi:hypothetical protein
VLSQCHSFSLYPLRGYDAPVRRAQIASIALCALSCSTLKLPLDLQARVDAAPIGTEVLVPAGSWTGELTIRRPVTLRGAGREATTLSGVHPIVVLSPGVTLESLTLRGSESGLRVAGHAEVTLRHLQVTSPGFAIAVDERSTLKSDDLKVRTIDRVAK